MTICLPDFPEPLTVGSRAEIANVVETVLSRFDARLAHTWIAVPKANVRGTLKAGYDELTQARYGRGIELCARHGWDADAAVIRLTNAINYAKAHPGRVVYVEGITFGRADVREVMLLLRFMRRHASSEFNALVRRDRTAYATAAE